MDRTVLHCDLNSFYASVEELYHPETRGKPIAVGGDVDARHGIILAKNQPAKKFGIQTGEALWQAKLKCPDLIIYKPNYARYMLFSRRVREIFHDYTDLIEPFGLDEAWLDVTGSGIYGTGEQIADTLRRRILNELGVTASVGVSFNKIFAKLGSDLRKPDFTTVISRDNFRQLVWPLESGELLYVGRSSQRRLAENGINTIGQIAQCSPEKLRKILGKWGEVLWSFANGYDDSPVARYDSSEIIKSIGNSVTCYRDLACQQDLDIVMYVLAESVASRLRDHGFQCRLVSIYLRTNELLCFSRQMAVEPTDLASEIMKAVRTLYRNNYHWQKPLRSVGVRAGKLVSNFNGRQLSLFADEKQRQKEGKLERVIDEIRSRYGFYSIRRLSMLMDQPLSSFDPKGEHVIFPESYF
ncbi:MAG: DNA polymerase IV [Erysipelotrichaceae bacterium]|nr:DNA polymerase IV [Erysipelotrichaceae bacterium]